MSKAKQLIEDGELSKAAKTLQSAGLALGIADTLAQLRDREKQVAQWDVPSDTAAARRGVADRVL